MRIENLTEKDFGLYTLTGKFIAFLKANPKSIVEVRHILNDYALKDGIALWDIEITPNLPPEQKDVIYVVSIRDFLYLRTMKINRIDIFTYNYLSPVYEKTEIVGYKGLIPLEKDLKELFKILSPKEFGFIKTEAMLMLLQNPEFDEEMKNIMIYCDYRIDTLTFIAGLRGEEFEIVGFEYLKYKIGKDIPQEIKERAGNRYGIIIPDEETKEIIKKGLYDGVLFLKPYKR